MSPNSEKTYKESRMYREILQEPASITKTVESLEEAVKAASDLLKASEIVFLTGSGTSYNAGFIGEMAFTNRGIPAIAVKAPDLIHFLPRKAMKATVVLLSQSGESREVKAAFGAAKKKGYSTIGITNERGSFLGTNSDIPIITRAGRERSLAATKTFAAEVAAILALVHYLSGWRRFHAEIRRIRMVSERIQSMLGELDYLVGFSSKISGNVVFLGDGYLHPIAMEGAIKIGETTGAFTQAFPIGEYLHGPLRSLRREDTVIILKGGNSSEARRVSATIRRYCRNLIVIGPEEGDDIKVPRIRYPELLPFIYVIPIQLLANFKAISMGLDPDHPERLKKVIT
ncbi:MAG: SIS domain-containing protein [Thermoplasmata archaeon]